MQAAGGWIPQSEVVRTLSDHAAGWRPDSNWREHDDLVNYQGDITQVNLILQTRRDVVTRPCNLLSNVEKVGFTHPIRTFHSHSKQKIVQKQNNCDLVISEHSQPSSCATSHLKLFTMKTDHLKIIRSSRRRWFVFPDLHLNCSVLAVSPPLYADVEMKSELGWTQANWNAPISVYIETCLIH